MWRPSLRVGLLIAMLALYVVGVFLISKTLDASLFGRLIDWLIFLFFIFLKLRWTPRLFRRQSPRLHSAVAQPHSSSHAASAPNGRDTRQQGNVPQWFLDQRSNPTTTLSDGDLRTLAGMSNQEKFLRLLQPMLVPRVAGTPGNLQVQQVRSESVFGPLR